MNKPQFKVGDMVYFPGCHGDEFDENPLEPPCCGLITEVWKQQVIIHWSDGVDDKMLKCDLEQSIKDDNWGHYPVGKVEP